MALRYIIIGGSAGSFKPVVNMLSSLPFDFPYPIFVCLHRLKHIRQGFTDTLTLKSKLQIVEPVDGELIMKGRVYFAPANYHMYFAPDNSIALSTEAPVNHSRPSIDISFQSAAKSFKSKMIGIILSGANRDGALGLKQVKENGGITIVQEPAECQIDVMTKAAIEESEIDYILKTEDIISLLLKY